MVTAVIQNSAAGIKHPADEALKIPLVMAVTQNGLSAAGQIVTDSTGAFTFDLASLPSVPTYNGSGNMTTITYGPDNNGRSIRQTSTWANGVWMGDSAWVLA